MDPQKTLQTMQNFQKENMKMEMTEEMSKFCIAEDWLLLARENQPKNTDNTDV